ncbi:UDP-N-acetylmuramoyl-L-alanyl-D-glutamate--2,6-diaminopimelate ligase [Hydrogenophaga sp. 5NK40-0174]|uniref:UDP-N-acetylmuramoyl-L-alanyl-D-glutamate--2, 6-diaminopimelate ligase n=1 Tax=Hydrogenophaga sp. 5NK40-0174 TaxID=3127649 RepID=UPI003103B982
MMQTMSSAQAAQWLKARVSGGLHCDSRKIGPGDGFVAWPGAATDGRRFVADAIGAGAVGAVVERAGVEGFALDAQPVVAVAGLKSLAGELAATYYDRPSQSLDVLAVTGTNGKTSTAWWLAQLLNALGRPSGLVGTLGVGMPGRERAAGQALELEKTGLTTPDPVLLQAQLRRMVDGGASACVLEASSIGLEEGRLNATRIAVGLLTNVSQDHLDYHGDMDAYWRAKQRLFAWEGMEAAVINVDDARGDSLARHLSAEARLDVWTVTVQGRDARMSAEGIAHTPTGMRWTLVERNAGQEVTNKVDVSLPFVGDYNIHNLLCVAAGARALGIDFERVADALEVLTAVPGRMEPVASVDGVPLVLIDYAHTPDALEKALSALVPLAKARGGRLGVVAGCGGDRDRSKRPLMAAAAERLAQTVILTSDNPRSESPDAILAEMVAGLQQPSAAVVETDRAKAIALAVQNADPKDIVLIAGKGHEDYQEVAGVRMPFSDQEQARKALSARTSVSGSQEVIQ